MPPLYYAFTSCSCYITMKTTGTCQGTYAAYCSCSLGSNPLPNRSPGNAMCLNDHSGIIVTAVHSPGPLPQTPAPFGNPPPITKQVNADPERIAQLKKLGFRDGRWLDEHLKKEPWDYGNADWD